MKTLKLCQDKNKNINNNINLSRKFIQLSIF